MDGIYQRLTQERADLINEADGILQRAEQESRDLTDEERARVDAIEARVKQISGDLARIERQREAQRQLATAGNPGAPRITVQDRADDDQNGGFRDLAEFALAVRNACHPGAAVIDERLANIVRAQPSNFHQEAGTSEGYLVPPAFRQEIWDLVENFPERDLIDLVSPEPTSSNAVELDADETTPWGSTGIQAYWRSEAQQMQPSRLETEHRLVRLQELYAFVLATDELLADAPRLNARLTRGSAAAIRWKASEAIVNGTGVGQPLGYMQSKALVTVAKENGQAADTIVAQNIAKMFSRMLPASIRRAIWLCNSDVFPQLMTLTLGDQPIWLPPNGIQDAPGGFLLGRPVLFSDHAETLGDKGDIQLIDPLGYYATRREGVQFADSIHLYFDYGLRAFRWTFRFGGQPFLSGPVSPAKGAATKSHFVVLEARA